jgi:hypothetical protein
VLPEGARREKQMAAARKSRGRGFMVMTLGRKIVLQHDAGKLDYFRRLSATPQIRRATSREVNRVAPD